MGLFGKGWLKSSDDDELRSRKSEIESETDFDGEIEAIDAIDEELNRRAWGRYNSEDHSNESYGIHREHGWYLPNDD